MLKNSKLLNYSEPQDSMKHAVTVCFQLVYPNVWDLLFYREERFMCSCSQWLRSLRCWHVERVFSLYSICITVSHGMGIPRGEREGSPPQVPSSSSEAIMQSQRAHSNTSYLPRAQSQQIPPTFGIPHMKLGGYIHITGYSHQRDEQWLLVDSLFSKQRSGVGHRNT